MSKIVQQISVARIGAVTTEASGDFAGRFLFSEGFAGFDGHFPEHPILPAVVEIMTVVSLVGEKTGVRQRLVAVEEAKFLIPVRPNQEILVSCRTRNLKGRPVYEARLTVENTTTATLLVELADAKELP
jgi:3-hydroxyacyl-[acyl-carrier-protein] dehydratase